MNIEKIKELVKTIKSSDYRDYFAAIILNEKIDYLQDLEDLTENDLKYIENIYNYYMKNDISLFSEEIYNKIWEEVEED